MPILQCHNALQTCSISELVQFLHASCFSPVPSTTINAIRHNNLYTWPSFTAHNIKKYLPKSTATVKGHMDRLRKNAQSTKLKEALEHVDEPAPIQEDKTNALFVALGVTDADSTVYTPQSHLQVDPNICL
eukprot:588696-Ditylum_brightwellii.AAC.1